MPTAQAVRRKRVGRGRQEKDAESDRPGQAAGRLGRDGVAGGAWGWRRHGTGGAVRPGTGALRDISEDAQH